MREELLDPEEPRANVVGVGTGVKWSKGEPTGKPSVIVLVRIPFRYAETSSITATMLRSRTA
jgi:hypothetical protein